MVDRLLAAHLAGEIVFARQWLRTLPWQRAAAARRQERSSSSHRRGPVRVAGCRCRRGRRWRGVGMMCSVRMEGSGRGSWTAGAEQRGTAVTVRGLQRLLLRPPWVVVVEIVVVGVLLGVAVGTVNVIG